MKSIVLLVLSFSFFAHPEDLLVKFKNVSIVTPPSYVKIANRVYRIPSEDVNFRANNYEWIQKNHQLALRSTPNDPDFKRQWSLKPQANGADAKVSELWNRGIGGIDRKGNDVVIAVIDEGVDINHPDLKANIWRNDHEVADNGVDDDGNGYIDDVHGWNASNKTGTMSPSNHGTHVAGIIGAVGHNGQQISGLNWNVKILPIVLSSFQTDEVLRAYQYVIDLKRQWINSNGEKGANIVATNSSFGYDYADCESGEFPAWNDFFNQMGKLGILSAAATANNNVDVDKKGDVPTSCTSPYVVAVTNTTIDNVKYRGAGYGSKSIDLGAPGTNILSTVNHGRLDEYTGTSMATPHVAGAIGLLYSLAPESYIDSYVLKPGESILKIKEMLVEGVDANQSLKGITVSGGKLNVFRSFGKF